MTQELKVGERALNGIINYLAATADFIDITAETEEVTGMKVQEFGKMWGNPEFVQNLQEKLGADKVGEMATLLLRIMTLLATDMKDASPSEKHRVAKDLRKASSDLEAFIKLLQG